MIASGLLNVCRCCALRLEGKSQVGIIPICVSTEGRMMPCCTILSRLPASACASSMHTLYVPCRITFNITCSAALCLLVIILFIICRLASGRWGRLVGLLYGCTSGTLLFVYQISAADMTFFFSPEVTLAFFQNELLISFSTMPSLISSWYFV